MSSDNVDSSFEFQPFIKQLSSLPGVYQMLDNMGKVIYVGKAKNLKKRVASYFIRKSASSKTAHMVAKIADIKIIVTETEVEALLLECNLIKKLQPKYNILLRDDKSYPYVFVDLKQDYPRLTFYRGSRQVKGKLFGPFPNVMAVKETIEYLQRLCRLRSCRDVYFKNRTRPCLQYQIKRCSAPCVNYISKDDYQKDLSLAIDFLKGNSQHLLQTLEKRMMFASEQLAFEEAAMLRDQIQHLQTVQASQTISNQGGDADVLAVVINQDQACVVLIMVRQGQVVGSHSYFPKLPKLHSSTASEQQVMEAFVSQYYLHQHMQLAGELIANVDGSDILIDAIEQVTGKACKWLNPTRGLKLKWLSLAVQNAQLALQNQLASRASFAARYQALNQILQFETPINHMECFDISHTAGEMTVGSCVVFDGNGPKKSDYRKFNIEGITGGDDYAAMRQTLTRRYRRLLKEERSLPDLIIIDGGKGQVNIAKEVLSSLNLRHIHLIGVAKGVSRKVGLETIIIAYKGKSLQIDSDNPALHLIQYIRDEAHRFAIISHRHKREKQKVGSLLEDIEGVGHKRRQALLKRFGGLQNLKQASIEEIAKVPGISKPLAQKIYQFLKR